MLFLAFLALTINADDMAAKAEAAKQAMTAHDFNRASALYRELNQADPGDLAVEQNLGLALYSAGRYAESIRVFGQVLRADPANPPALLFSGIAWNRLDEPRRAATLLAKFLEGKSSASVSTLAWKELGIAYWTLAKQHFDWIDNHAPFTAEWFSLVARSELEREHYARAFQFYRNALARNSNLASVHSGLAEVYRKTGHADWAVIEESREPRQQTPAANETVQHYQEAIKDQQHAAEALEHLERTASGPGVHELLGFAYRAQQRDAESADEFHKAVLIEPDNRDLQKDWATSLWLSGECGQAMAILAPLLRINPQSIQLNHVMGDCLVQAKRPEDALPYLNNALRLDPHFLPAQASIGRAYLHLNRYGDAVTHLKEALPLADKSTLFQLAQAYKKSGNESVANQYLEKYKRYASLSNTISQMSGEAELSPP